MADGTKEGWDTAGEAVNIEGLGYALKLSRASGKDFQSNGFTVLPDDIYAFKSGLRSLTELTGVLGLHIGLTREQPFNAIGTALRIKNGFWTVPPIQTLISP